MKATSGNLVYILILFLYFSTFSPKFGIKANVWGVKYNLAKGQKIWRLVVPNTKEFEVNPRRFAQFIDKQSGEDSGLQIRSNSLWTKFVHNQEDRLRDSGNLVRFIMAELTGMQDQAITWEDRSTERYIFDYNSMFDHTVKKLSPIDCVFFPTLSTKKDAIPLLKSVRYAFYIMFIFNITLCKRTNPLCKLFM